MRILLVAERDAVAHAIVDALAAAGHKMVSVLTAGEDMVMGAQRAQPDALIVETEAPTRELLHSLQMLNERQAMPVVVFADRSDERNIRVAVRAGVSAYVVDGFYPARVVPVLEAATARFIEFESLRRERDEAVAKLSERRAIERAKGILMRRRDLAEDAAYDALRKMSASRGRRLLDMAESIITVEEALSQG